VSSNAWRDRYYASSDGLLLYYRDFPSPGSGRAPVLCLPGLTRNSRDFETTALRLKATRRVLCADLRGRGRSQYDPNWRNYHPGSYVADIALLLEDAGVERVILLGTSLGGYLSMVIAATTPRVAAGVILNDIGPEIDRDGLARIAAYVGRDATAGSWAEAAQRAREVNGHAFPELDDAQWLAFARRTWIESDGVIRLDMDPRIGDAVRAAPAAAAPDLWPLYAALVPVPTLAIRGATSDVLSVTTFDRMLRDKPDLRRVTVPGRGHAPSLDEPACVEAIDAFLAAVDQVSR
jgi:pimeloyl-ACP methyl ester carboxylesterase